MLRKSDCQPTYIIKVIAEADRPFIRESLTKQLGITTEQDLGAVRRRFNAMLRSSQLVGNDCDCYALPSQLDLIHGRVISYSDGFGLLVPDSGGKDMFLSAAGQMHTLFHGSSP